MCETLGTDWEATARENISLKLEAWKAIQRVHELANHWLTGQSDEIPYDAGQFATALLKALDGEQ